MIENTRYGHGEKVGEDDLFAEDADGAGSAKNDAYMSYGTKNGGLQPEAAHLQGGEPDS